MEADDTSMNNWLTWTPDSIYAPQSGFFEGEKLASKYEYDYNIDLPHYKEIWQDLCQKLDYTVTSLAVTNDGKFILEGYFNKGEQNVSSSF